LMICAGTGKAANEPRPIFPTTLVVRIFLPSSIFDYILTKKI